MDSEGCTFGTEILGLGSGGKSAIRARLPALSFENPFPLLSAYNLPLKASSEIKPNFPVKISNKVRILAEG